MQKLIRVDDKKLVLWIKRLGDTKKVIESSWSDSEVLTVPIMDIIDYLTQILESTEHSGVVGEGNDSDLPKLQEELLLKSPFPLAQR